MADRPDEVLRLQQHDRHKTEAEVASNLIRESVRDERRPVAIFIDTEMLHHRLSSSVKMYTLY